MITNIDTTIVTITPNLAHSLLAADEEARKGTNEKNRRQDVGIIRQYEAAMKNGEWALNGEPIIISNNNLILDGQHRLVACVKAGVSFPSLMVWGIDPSAFSTINIGKTRTAGDILYIANVPDANNMAGIITRFYAIKEKHVTQFERGGLRLAAFKKGRNEVLKYYHEHKDSCTKACSIAKVAYAKRRLLTVSTIGGYALYLHDVMGHPYEVIESFFMQVFTGTGITNNVCLVLQDKLLKYALKEKRYSPQELTAYIHKSWNAFVTGKDIKALLYSMEKEGSYIPLI